MKAQSANPPSAQSFNGTTQNAWPASPPPQNGVIPLAPPPSPNGVPPGYTRPPKGVPPIGFAPPPAPSPYIGIGENWSQLNPPGQGGLGLTFDGAGSAQSPPPTGGGWATPQIPPPMIERPGERSGLANLLMRRRRFP